MNILVIGSNGFIGRHSVEYFSARGHSVVGAGRVDDFTTLFREAEFDVCINASGSANVGMSFDNPEKDFELNVSNVHKILLSIRRHNPRCRLLNFSSASVYGNPVSLPIRESAKLSPVSPYGFHKLQSEYLLTEYHKFFGIHTCSLRVFSCYGTRLRKQLFWDLHQKTLSGKSIEIFGTGEESRDFIFIEDLLRAVEIVLEKGNFEGECINVASGIETKIKDAVRLFYAQLGGDVRYSFTGKIKIGDPNNWRADISLLSAMGFSPKISLEEGLKLYVKWLKENA
jgi:dTDP-glucose 4,6-dehydratase/UDP-glucose 4-epimerase